MSNYKNWAHRSDFQHLMRNDAIVRACVNADLPVIDLVCTLVAAKDTAIAQAVRNAQCQPAISMVEVKNDERNARLVALLKSLRLKLQDKCPMDADERGTAVNRIDAALAENGGGR